MRYFTPWLRRHHVEQYYLPRMIRNLTERTTVPIGDAVISTPDTTFGVETCEELFTPRAPHVDMALNGVEIMSNSMYFYFSDCQILIEISHRSFTIHPVLST